MNAPGKTPGNGAPKDKPDKSGQDWGLSKRKPAMSRETKIGLVLILVLVGAFGFVVVRKMQRRDDFLAETEDVDSKRHKHHKKPEPVPPFDGRKKRGGLHVAQGEPNLKPFDGHSGTAHVYDDRHQHHQHSDPFPGGQDGSDQPTGSPFGSTADSGHGKATVQPDDFFPGEQSEPGSGSPFPGGNSTTPNDGFAGRSQNIDAWDLGDGWETDAGYSQAAGNTQRNPFEGTGHGHSHDHGSHNAQDGFQNANTGQGPFGDSNTTARQQPGGDARDDTPGGLFGGSPDQHAHSHSHGGQTTVQDTTGGFPQRNDSRFGGYDVGVGGQAHAHSTTQVRRVSTQDELQYPFGRPDQSRKSTDDSSSGFPDSGSAHGGLRQPTEHGHADHIGRHGALQGSELNHTHRHPRGAPPAAGDRPRIHTVRPGDNYWTISRKAYATGVYYHALAAYNSYRIPDPKKMRPGMKVLVPSAEILAARYPKLCPRNAAGPTLHHERSSGFFRDRGGNPMYRVGKTDTLSGIAQQHLGRASRWIQVYRMNRTRIKDPNRLKIGTELQLPADASNLRLVRQPSEIR